MTDDAAFLFATWGPAWRALRDDVNTLAWLFEQERVILRTFMEAMFWALTGERVTIDEFAQTLGLGVATEVPADDTEPEGAGSLGPGGEGEGGDGIVGDFRAEQDPTEEA